MKSFFHNTVSFIDHRICGGRIQSHGNSFAALVAGYSRLNESDTQYGLKQSVRSAPSALLCANVIAAGEQSSPDEEVLFVSHRGQFERQFKYCIAVARGQLISTSNETVVARFDDVDSALRCAVNAQIALNKRNACLRPNQQVHYRMSINICESDLRGIRSRRRDVNFTPVFDDASDVPGIFVSRLARENLRDRSKVHFVSLGKRYLPNCREPVEALWIEMDRSQLFELTPDLGEDPCPEGV